MMTIAHTHTHTHTHIYIKRERERERERENHSINSVTLENPGQYKSFEQPTVHCCTVAWFLLFVPTDLPLLTQCRLKKKSELIYLVLELLKSFNSRGRHCAESAIILEMVFRLQSDLYSSLVCSRWLYPCGLKNRTTPMACSSCVSSNGKWFAGENENGPEMLIDSVWQCLPHGKSTAWCLWEQVRKLMAWRKRMGL